MAFIAMLVALLTTQSTAQAPSRDAPVRWHCRHSVEMRLGRLDVSRNLDADGRPLYDYLFWEPHQGIGSSPVGWQRLDPPTSYVLPWRLRTDMINAELNLARPARRPVWLVLRVDGQVVTRRLLLRQMRDLPEYDREHLNVMASFMAEGPRATPVPNVTNADELLVTAEEEGGETLARYAIPLPGRDIIDAVIAQAQPVLADAVADYRNRCREDREPPATAPTPG